MLETADILGKFHSLKEYEKFNLEWTRECAKLNPTERNKRRLEDMEYRAKLMKLEA